MRVALGSLSLRSYRSSLNLEVFFLDVEWVVKLSLSMEQGVLLRKFVCFRSGEAAGLPRRFVHGFTVVVWQLCLCGLASAISASFEELSSMAVFSSSLAVALSLQIRSHVWRILQAIIGSGLVSSPLLSVALRVSSVECSSSSTKGRLGFSKFGPGRFPACSFESSGSRKRGGLGEFSHPSAEEASWSSV